jgi:ribosomal protein S18 acetylase RimI-like enzyme
VRDDVGAGIAHEMCRVRVSGPADDAALATLLVDTFVSTYAHKLPHVVVSPGRRADLSAIAPRRAHGEVLVAEIQRELVGTVTVLRPGFPGTRAWTANTAELRYLAVDPRFQGRGHSRALLDRAVALARGWGAATVCLHVRREAEAVARLFRSYGFIRDAGGDVDLLPEVFLEAYRLALR